jgi:hypothetical protein
MSVIKGVPLIGKVAIVRMTLNQREEKQRRQGGQGGMRERRREADELEKQMMRQIGGRQGGKRKRRGYMRGEGRLKRLLVINLQLSAGQKVLMGSSKPSKEGLCQKRVHCMYTAPAVYTAGATPQPKSRNKRSNLQLPRSSSRCLKEAVLRRRGA